MIANSQRSSSKLAAEGRAASRMSAKPSAVPEGGYYVAGTPFRQDARLSTTSPRLDLGRMSAFGSPIGVLTSPCNYFAAFKIIIYLGGVFFIDD